MKLLRSGLIVFGFAALLLSGCMMGMHGMDHGPSHQQSAKSMVKEFADKDITLTLEVPPLVIGESATLLLTAYHIERETPVTEARVTYRIERIETTRSGHAEHPTSASEVRAAEEIAGQGVYQLRYHVRDGGLYKITARLWMEGKGGARSMSVSLTQATGRSDYHDEASRRTWMILGGIGMAAMMAVMIF